MVGLEKSLALIHDFPALYHLNRHLQNQTSFVSSEIFLLKGSEWRQGFLWSTGNQCWRTLIISLYPSSPFDTIPHNKPSLEQTWFETVSPGRLVLTVRRAAEFHPLHIQVLFLHFSNGYWRAEELYTAFKGKIPVLYIFLPVELWDNQLLIFILTLISFLCFPYFN